MALTPKHSAALHSAIDMQSHATTMTDSETIACKRSRYRVHTPDLLHAHKTSAYTHSQALVGVTVEIPTVSAMVFAAVNQGPDVESGKDTSGDLEMGRRVHGSSSNGNPPIGGIGDWRAGR
ncbi:hypothetical protein L210DRAFT_3505446 [Boletus edulis BED1]|uniref:Uncharacterized protein n=1 Tax=Boletus edulis BED1 TaxID=1328754 RepID=A0AAD4BQD3_BOLED|nr:hypothetical protein L210DRAFT_3505446 [Boletus edulis BED1]